MNRIESVLNDIADIMFEATQILVYNRLLREEKQFSVDGRTVVRNYNMLLHDKALLKQKIADINIAKGDLTKGSSYKGILELIQNIKDISSFMDEVSPHLS